MTCITSPNLKAQARQYLRQGLICVDSAVDVGVDLLEAQILAAEGRKAWPHLPGQVLCVRPANGKSWPEALTRDGLIPNLVAVDTYERALGRALVAGVDDVVFTLESDLFVDPYII